MIPERWRLAVLAALVGSSQAQLVQNGSKICSWGQLRGESHIPRNNRGQLITFAANVVSDTVYLDGGELYKEM